MGENEGKKVMCLMRATVTSAMRDSVPQTHFILGCDPQTVTFKPGPMEIDYDEKGLVTLVKEKGQAKQNGIREGFRVLKVGNVPYMTNGETQQKKSAEAVSN